MMNFNSVSNICICGAGTMGSGIAQVTATAGFTTILFDVDENVLIKAKEKIKNGLQKLVEKQKLPAEEIETIFRRISFTANLQNCKADVVIEAIIENSKAKIWLLQQVAALNSSATILATNTSSLSITQLAQHLPQPERFLGMHFFNPAPVMKLVEIVKTDSTSPEIVQTLVQLAVHLGKTPVVCADAPGFIVNRVARPFYIESLYLAEQGMAGFQTIDQLLEARGFKMGPFTLMDLIGNDINYAVSCIVYEQLNQPERLRPSPLQKEKVEKNELGKKTGKGYYTY